MIEMDKQEKAAVNVGYLSIFCPLRSSTSGTEAKTNVGSLINTFNTSTKRRRLLQKYSYDETEKRR